MSSENEASGGCRCGAIRYVVTGVPEQVVVCHCQDCRRSVGAQSVAWLLHPKAGFEVSRGNPVTHGSSPGVTRAFCGSCGTSLWWLSEEHPARVDITLGSLDDPERFKPMRAVHRKQMLAWASQI